MERGPTSQTTTGRIGTGQNYLVQEQLHVVEIIFASGQIQFGQS
jgi:hypothetical protein